MAAGALILAGALLAGALPDGAAPRIEWRAAGTGAGLRICGPAAAHPERLEVHLVPPGAPVAADLPPLWGELAADGECALFRPRHRPAAGLELVVSAGGEILGRVALAPAKPRVQVDGIYPSGETIPANLLRLYVEFSGPMSLKGIEKHVHLRDARGDEIPTAFVEIPDGLWDPGRRRLTLLLHPGRVKSGIAVGEELGPVLRQGEAIRLEIDPEARDADGAPLAAGGERRWQVGSRQDGPLREGDFRLRAEPGELVVDAARSLDRALARGALRVLQDGREVPGEWRIEQGERRLRFAPAAPWRPGESGTLEIGARLEDVAGNRPGRAFEVEAGAAAEARPIAIPFRPPQ